VPNKLPEGVDMLDVPAGFDLERMDEVLKIKTEANGKFREGDYFSAKCLYSGALEMLERCCLHLEKSDQTWESIKNNMALCDLKRQEWTRVIEATTEILTRNPSNTKALYRRGVARAGHGKLQEAQRDLKMAVEMEPANEDARKKLMEVNQKVKENRSAEKDQADKMRGFLRGERLEDTVSITADGGIRKVHSNENAPLYPSWIKRAWFSPNSRMTAVITAEIVMKAPAGQEVFTTRKPPGALAQQPVGPHVVKQYQPAGRSAAPARWVIDDAWHGVFHAWNAAGKTLQIGELGRFEIAKHTLGPSVESAVTQCLERWLPDSPDQRKLFEGVPEDIQAEAKRKQALQILGFPEEFCLDVVPDPNSTLNMEMELLKVEEYMDINGDGKCLFQEIRPGKKRTVDLPQVTELCTVTAHFRILKFLLSYGLKDTRMGLASGSDGLVMKEDKTKEPLEFIVGEEEAPMEGTEFVPPCIGRCLLLPPGGVVEGMHFELVLRDGVPVSDMERAVYTAYADKTMEGMPDATGPVSVRIEVESIVPAIAGPSTPGWKGVASMRQEADRARELETMEEGRYRLKALKRWRRIISWLEVLLEARRWKLQGEGKGAGDGGDRGGAQGDTSSAAAPSSMYDVEWEDEEADGTGEADDGQAAKPDAQPDLPEQTSTTTSAGEAVTSRASEAMPQLFEVPEDLLKQLQPEEMCEWAVAHTSASKLLQESDKELAEKHARCAVQATAFTKIPQQVEVDSRSLLAARLLDSDKSAEALEVLKTAQALDPTSQLLRDQSAVALQKEGQRRTLDMKGTLKQMKQDLNSGLEADDSSRLLGLLEELDDLPLTWDAVNETAVGKEVGKCAKHADATVAGKAKAIIGKLHQLAKQQRPLWVR